MLKLRNAVLHKHDYQLSDRFVYFELQREEGDFDQTDGYYMTKQCFEDMGSPETITVTVAPGDRLN